MILIDGSHGEGGGQILRTSLALALVTGKQFRIERIRANREKPGLLRQHLTAVNAAAEVGNAETEGAYLGSKELTFTPQAGGAAAIIGGEYHFQIGTAGSTTLVFQTVLPALALAKSASRVRLEGGTHNRQAPPFDFLERAFLPLISRMGVHVKAELQRYGFYPAGGGAISFRVEPIDKFQPLELVERGAVVKREARAVCVNLPRGIAEREIAVVENMLGWTGEELRIETARESLSPGNYVCVEVECKSVREVFSAIGARGVRAEAVAESAATEAERYFNCEGAAVGEHLADQLLVPMALAGSGCFTTLEPLTLHTTTNIETIKRFLAVDFQVRSLGNTACLIEAHS